MKKDFFERKQPFPVKIKAVFVLILVVFTINVVFPQAVRAQSPLSASEGVMELVWKSQHPLDLLTERFVDYSNNPNGYKTQDTVISTMSVVATAYSSTVDQCDSTPCITANGFNVCKHGVEDTIAANFLKFGTKVKIPELYGDKIFIVRDRMNPRYDYRIDVWMTDRNKAISFGKRLVTIQVVE